MSTAQAVMSDKYSGLAVGEQVTLNVNPGSCSFCSQQFIMSAEATYMGRVEEVGSVYHEFQYINQQYCPHCHEPICGYREGEAGAAISIQDVQYSLTLAPAYTAKE